MIRESDRLDYESQCEVVILVRTTDNGNPPLSKQVCIHIYSVAFYFALFSCESYEMGGLHVVLTT